MAAIDAQPLVEIALRSRKRTLDMFLGNRGSRLSEDVESLRMKLVTKIGDDYGAVRDMPPPAPPKPAVPKAAVSVVGGPPASSVGPAAAAAAVVPAVSSNSSGSTAHTQAAADLVVVGPAAVPPGPGIAANADDQADETLSQDSSTVRRMLDSLPTKPAGRQAAVVSSSIVQYREAAGIVERHAPPTKSRALVVKNPYLAVKPDWHPPWKLMRVISGHLGWVRAAAVDVSNEWFATGSADRTIKIWELASGTLKLTLTGHINTVRGLAVSTRHPYLFSCGEDKQVKCWDLEYNKVIRHYHGHLSGVYCMAMHPTIDVLITGGRDSSARVWDIRTKANVFTLSGHQSTVAAVACQSSDPQVITGSNDSTIRLWDLAKGSTSATLTHHKKSVRALALHPVDFSFASGAPDNIKLWKCPEGKFMTNFSGHNAIIHSMSVNRDNVLVSAADNGSMHFWDWKTGYAFQKLQTVVQPGSLASEAGVFVTTFDQTGSRLITGEADKTIKIYREDANATPETHPVDDHRASRKKY
eukprot:TRINITY_DN765_c0_g1_i2.p1 TRINITY_DN765_c0_g1~~TRINITY_DN765_c0_g1_i2.p1  ORF type:complete len:527 (-),score=199.21 TRINITY_DN765_c0_g1_i2:2823-4403(-)